MKLKCVVLILAAMLVSIGFAKAGNPTSINPQPVTAKPVVEVEEPTGILTSVADKIERQDSESICSDSEVYDSGHLNLSFQYSYPPDSTDFSLIQYYIKHVMPILNNIDTKRYDLIEIL